MVLWFLRWVQSLLLREIICQCSLVKAAFSPPYLFVPMSRHPGKFILLSFNLLFFLLRRCSCGDCYNHLHVHIVEPILEMICLSVLPTKMIQHFSLFEILYSVPVPPALIWLLTQLCLTNTFFYAIRFWRTPCRMHRNGPAYALLSNRLIQLGKP